MDWRELQLSSWRPNLALRSEGQLRRADGRAWKHLVRDHCRLPAYFGPVLHLRAMHQAWADSHQAAAAEAAASAVYCEVFTKVLSAAAQDAVAAAAGSISNDSASHGGASQAGSMTQGQGQGRDVLSPTTSSTSAHSPVHGTVARTGSGPTEAAARVVARLRDAAPLVLHLAEHAVAYESQQIWPARAPYHRACRAWCLRSLLREVRQAQD